MVTFLYVKQILLYGGVSVNNLNNKEVGNVHAFPDFWP